MPRGPHLLIAFLAGEREPDCLRHQRGRRHVLIHLLLLLQPEALGGQLPLEALTMELRPLF